MNEPLAYFITFTTYGTWLHGNAKGSVGRQSDGVYRNLSQPNPDMEQSDRERMPGPSFTMSSPQRAVVDKTLREVTRHRRWDIHALNVRTNHVHVVVEAPETAPESVMNDFKAWATRRLREAGLVDENAKLWTRHGSTRHLFDAEALMSAIDYVKNRQ